MEEKEILKIFNKVDSNNKREILNFCIFGSSVFFIVVSSWNIATSVGDIIYDYSVGRSEAEFIISNNLTNYNIMSDWQINYDESSEKVLSQDTKMFGKYICVAPYFDNNIVYNFNNGEQDRNYIDHKVLSKDDNNKNIAIWRQKGYPDVILGNVRLDLIFDREEVSYDDYSLIYIGRHKKMWKIPNRSSYIVPIFIRNDLLKESGLKSLDKSLLPDNWNVIYNGGEQV